MAAVTVVERTPSGEHRPLPCVASSVWGPLVPLWESCDQGWFVYGPDGRLVHENRALLQLLHRRPDPGRTSFVAEVVPSARRGFERRWAELRSGRRALVEALLPVELHGTTSALQLTMVGLDVQGGRVVVGTLRRPVATSEPAGAATRVEEVLGRVLSELLAVAPEEQDGSHPPEASLSTRQREVMELLVAGECTSAIATHLSVSPHTVRNHTKAIFRALGVHSQAELIHRHRRSPPTPTD